MAASATRYTEEVRADEELEAGAYLDHLTPEQRRSALWERKVWRIDEAYQETREAYTDKEKGRDLHGLTREHPTHRG